MNPAIELPISNLNELPALARFILSFAGNARHLMFEAPMGAGKTTFIKELCLALGSNDNFSSPTYSVVNEYVGEQGKIYHFDLYRLKNREELMDIGIEEYLSSGSYCFFEWPELVKEFVEVPYLKIELEMEGNNRYLRATKF